MGLDGLDAVQEKEWTLTETDRLIGSSRIESSWPVPLASSQCFTKAHISWTLARRGWIARTLHARHDGRSELDEEPESCQCPMRGRLSSEKATEQIRVCRTRWSSESAMHCHTFNKARAVVK
jgi:hypothetical protein